MKLAYPNQQTKMQYIDTLLSVPELEVEAFTVQEEVHTIDREKHLKPIVSEIIAKINNIASLTTTEFFISVIDKLTQLKITDKKALPEEFFIKKQPLNRYCKEFFQYLCGDKNVITSNINNKKIDIDDSLIGDLRNQVQLIANKASEQIVQEARLSLENLRRSPRKRMSNNIDDDDNHEEQKKVRFSVSPLKSPDLEKNNNITQQ